MSVVINARITKTEIGFYNRFAMTCWLFLEWQGAGQGFGGYCLDRRGEKSDSRDDREGTAYGAEFIRRILTTLEAERWEDLAGMYLRVRKSHAFGDILAIGHIINDRWFEPKEDLAHLVAAAAEGGAL